MRIPNERLSEAEYLGGSQAYCEEIYLFAKGLPANERYNLSDQIRRSVVSIPLTIAEG
ncbi:four helix bundle protein [Candidatus Nitrospira bockiana]